jgi:hypothetical protein
MSASTVEAHDYGHLIGTSLTVGSSDNQEFAAYLPRKGTVIRQIALEDWGSDWLVLRLDEPFEYQLGSLDTGFRVARITHFVVRSRLLGHPIGAQPTSVFLLLDADHVFDTKEQFCSADFLHVTWAMIPPL